MCGPWAITLTAAPTGRWRCTGTAAAGVTRRFPAPGCCARSGRPDPATSGRPAPTTTRACTATYPSLQKIQNLTPAQAQAETCGSLATLKAHGLPGAAGMIAYPGSYTKNPAVVNLQTQYGQTCFDWGRQYHHAF